MNQFKKNKMLLMLSGSILVAGCQSDVSSSNSNYLAFEQTNHISQSVYEIEYLSAYQLAFEAEQLAMSSASYCRGELELEDVRAQWQVTAHRWMSLQGQERGPSAALEKSWSIQFWPDKKNTTGRKLSQLIAKNQHWTSEQVQAESVAVPGLGAVEWLLYDSQSPILSDAKNESCHVLNAITDTVSINARSIEQAWQTNPWTSLDKVQWESELVSLLSNQLEYLLKKLERPLASVGKPRPYFSESWRSKTSLNNLKYNVLSAKELYLAGGDKNSLDQHLRQKGHVQVADSIIEQFDLTLETWPEEASLFDMLQTKDGYRNALALYNKLEQIKYLIHEEAAISLGVIVGFNATDGD